ncbi:hypothetical protein [Wolbachia endosymbiont (group A) of Philanthus triangulum]|uniref:hypothetical protein n=1 Tax=unclassified Wolbachia TaxID=2640676 RepID=UPI0033426ACC
MPRDTVNKSRYDVSLATYSLVIPVLLFLSSQRHALVSTLYHGQNKLSKIH